MKRISDGFLGAAVLRIPLSLIPASPALAGIRLGVMVSVGPPDLPWYPQPVCPGNGYIWVPGYWAYGSFGYYWVPGAWVFPPTVGLLWTPGYWSSEGGHYRWHPGYWGRHVGFYGGIDYGDGYPGRGYHGGYWRGSHFYYNVDVNNVDRDRAHFVYSKPLPPRRETSPVSYNGGKGGIDARPTARERAWSRERHFGLTAVQKQRAERARNDPAMRYKDSPERTAEADRLERAPPRHALRRPEPARESLRPGFRIPRREAPVPPPGNKRVPPGETRPGKPRAEGGGPFA